MVEIKERRQIWASAGGVCVLGRFGEGPARQPSSQPASQSVADLHGFMGAARGGGRRHSGQAGLGG